MPHPFSRNTDLNWNRLFFAGFGLVLLTGLALHQGEVPQPGGGDTGLLSGTALRDPAAQAARDLNLSAADKNRQCAATADARASTAAGDACSESRDEKRLAQNDPPE